MIDAVSVVGLGKLGCSVAAAVASCGVQVIGVDMNPNIVAAVNAGRAPAYEPGLDVVIAANAGRLRATTDIAEAVAASDLTFVLVPTPSDERGAFSTALVEAVFRSVGDALRTIDRYHIVVLMSTVLPGATRYSLIPAIEEVSGKRAGVDFGLCYSPEFVAIGSVLRDFLRPDFVLIGEHDKRAGSNLEEFFNRSLPGSVRVARMSLENAELTKIAINTYVSTKITFANMLAAICEQIPGGDVDTVTMAAGLDRRISSAYFTGALGFGGTCFPRDTVAFDFVAHSLGVNAEVVRAATEANLHTPQRVVDVISGLAAPQSPVAILGLAFKPGTYVVEESQALMIASGLRDAGFQVHGYDPLVLDTQQLAMGPGVTLHESAQACIEAASVIVIANPDAAFGALTPADFLAGRDRVTVFDCWRKFRSVLDGQPGISYVPLGCGAENPEHAERLRRLWA